MFSSPQEKQKGKKRKRKNPYSNSVPQRAIFACPKEGRKIHTAILYFNAPEGNQAEVNVEPKPA